MVTPGAGRPPPPPATPLFLHPDRFFSEAPGAYANMDDQPTRLKGTTKLTYHAATNPCVGKCTRKHAIVLAFA